MRHILWQASLKVLMDTLHGTHVHVYGRAMDHGHYVACDQSKYYASQLEKVNRQGQIPCRQV